MNRDILSAGPWTCSAREECHSLATGTVLTPMSYLHLNPPFILECLPILRCADPLCEIAAKKDTKRFMKDASKAMECRPGASGNERTLYAGKLRVCDKCGAIDAPGKTLLKCTRCGVAYYCGKDCQRSDWKAHKPRCAPS